MDRVEPLTRVAAPPTKRRRAHEPPALTEPSSETLKPCHLLSTIPEELLAHVAHQFLASGVPATVLCKTVVNFCKTCRAARSSVALVLAAIKRLRFDKSLCQNFQGMLRSKEGDWLWQVRLPTWDGGADAWACCGLLPLRGVSCWRVRVDMTYMQGGNFFAGVTDASARWAWGLFPARGHMRRWHRDAARRVCGAPAPPGYPKGHLTHVLYDDDGAKTDLAGRTTVGCTIDVIYDADEGTLAYRVAGGKILKALSGFPKNVAMRPWVRVGSGDTLSIRPLCAPAQMP